MMEKKREKKGTHRFIFASFACVPEKSELLHAATRGFQHRKLLRAIGCCAQTLHVLSSSKLLSTVAAVWPMLVIRVHKRPDCPHTLDCVSVLCNAAGGNFMAQRIQKDLWPLLQVSAQRDRETERDGV